MKQDKDYWSCLYSLLMIVLIALKAFGLVELSWLWILFPLWALLGICVTSMILLLAILAIGMFIGLVGYLVDMIKERIKGRNENSKKG